MDLLENPTNHSIVEESKKKIMEVGVVPKILSKQEKEG
jgi:hypothetical protein